MKDLSKKFELFKPGIVFLVVLTGITAYGLSYQVEQTFDIFHALSFIVGLAFLSAGSLGLNQVQEVSLDLKMQRTQGRPIPAGMLTKKEALLISLVALLVGLFLLLKVSHLTAGLGLLTVVLYNGFYTLWWKQQMAFAAVPGAIPGAMPVVIGYSANSEQIFSPPCLYLFLVMFVWQMPHFWALAIRYRKDYAEGGVPVLPVKEGLDRTLYHMGLYTFIYVILALVSPWFVTVSICYFLIVLPMAAKVLWEFFKYFKKGGEQGWLPFFLWVNFSLLGFLFSPVVDKWIHFYWNVIHSQSV